MGILVDYFLADTDADAAAALSPSGIPGRAEVDGHGMEPTVYLSKLQSILTGQSYEAIVDGGRAGELVASEHDYAALVLTVTDELRDALASTDDSALRDAAIPWSRTEECMADRRRPEDLGDFLVSLAGLARRAAPGQRIYAEIHV